MALFEMGKRKKKTGNHHGLQGVTLCISTAMVLVLLGIVVLSVLSARNLSDLVKENLVIRMELEPEITNSEALRLCDKIKIRPYINHLDFVSKEQALKEGTKALGVNPEEFAGANPFLSAVEVTLKSAYANNDSLAWITKELKRTPNVSEIFYQKDLINEVNKTLARISIVLLILAALLTFVSFSLINNTVRLSIYARRFSIHTMKLVGASWGFIRRPFIRQAVLIGLIAAFIACLVIGGCVYALYYYEPEILTVVTWQVLAVTAVAVFVFGIIITTVCAHISVNKFLRMKASELYKI